MKEWIILGVLIAVGKLCMVTREPKMTYAYKKVKQDIHEKYALKLR